MDNLVAKQLPKLTTNTKWAGVGILVLEWHLLDFELPVAS